MAGCLALVVGAGRGARFGGELPKQYHDLAGRAVLRYSLEAFLAHPDVDEVRAVINMDDRDLYDEAVGGLALLDPVGGGAARQDSVRLGLESLIEYAPERVLIHDAARPFIDGETISRIIDALNNHSAAIPGMPVNDTLKRGEDGVITQTVSRDGLWRAQTPQGFRFPEILAAHQRFAGRELTDDAALAEAAGLDVRLVQGSEDNMKVTTQDDFSRAKSYLAGAREFRNGTGFDVHRFDTGDHIMLCGVKIPHDFGLSGHSDADVGLHALTDAILGAIAQGDIGSHFPPSDDQWRGAESHVFLRHANDLVRARGGEITALDVTLICEAPKIGPHRDAMRARIAEILDIDIGRVSVKGTTTERLGFTGRKEGIAAQASATIALQTRTTTRE
ncbi:MAG: bifunctional 2-C-methyl-D-erythritol 4-phosphate cytidylyltransferase/2-C-methyl-D-erythritol 2,4-cyclodiphosphate synthase [Rhodospirillales bacterium]|nr:bifunctional 2-C-methyl-D-erythritol 4-phosphate cytidylyltransferase/2-C-methyl-D-erythritol 2,4-cyclodiphosphate synthase [Rhodospirillales bacterium]